MWTAFNKVATVKIEVEKLQAPMLWGFIFLFHLKDLPVCYFVRSSHLFFFGGGGTHLKRNTKIIKNRKSWEQRYINGIVIEELLFPVPIFSLKIVIAS